MDILDIVSLSTTCTMRIVLHMEAHRDTEGAINT